MREIHVDGTQENLPPVHQNLDLKLQSCNLLEENNFSEENETGKEDIVSTPIIPRICQIISTTEISDRANFSYALHKKFTS